jgi:hypothetical protein
MAAFYASQYREAVPPLTRLLQKQPGGFVRSARPELIHGANFNGVIETLKPVQDQVDSDPGLPTRMRVFRRQVTTTKVCAA